MRLDSLLVAEQLQGAAPRGNRGGDRVAPLLPLFTAAPGLPLGAAALGVGRELLGVLLMLQRVASNRDALFDQRPDFLGFVQRGDHAAFHLGCVIVKFGVPLSQN